MGNESVPMHELEPLKEFQGIAVHSRKFTFPQMVGEGTSHPR